MKWIEGSVEECKVELQRTSHKPRCVLDAVWCNLARTQIRLLVNGLIIEWVDGLMDGWFDGWIIATLTTLTTTTVIIIIITIIIIIIIIKIIIIKIIIIIIIIEGRI